VKVQIRGTDRVRELHMVGSWAEKEGEQEISLDAGRDQRK
jgi:hypothetical protein